MHSKASFIGCISILFSTHTWSKACFSPIFGNTTAPQTCTLVAIHGSKSIHVKVSYPKKQREAVQMSAPFRTSEGLKRASLVTLESSGFPLRSVLVYSDTDRHIMYPKRGANTPVISEHHRKHTSGSLQRIKPRCTCGSKQTIAARRRREVQTLLRDTLEDFNAVVHCWTEAARLLLRASPARPASWRSVCTCVQRLDCPPPNASVEIIWAWSECCSFLPLCAHCKKSPMCTRCVSQLLNLEMF